MIVIPPTTVASTSYTAAATFTRLAAHDYGVLQFTLFDPCYFEVFEYLSGYNIQPYSEVPLDNPAFGANLIVMLGSRDNPLAGIRVRAQLAGKPPQFVGAFFEPSEVACSGMHTGSAARVGTWLPWPGGRQPTPLATEGRDRLLANWLAVQ